MGVTVAGSLVVAAGTGEMGTSRLVTMTKLRKGPRQLVLV